jgi:MOLPALP family lipoprotein
VIYRQDINSDNSTSQAIKGVIDYLNLKFNLKASAPALNRLFTDSFAPTIEEMFTDEKIGFPALREFSQKYLAPGAAENLSDRLYATDDSERTALASIKTSDVKKEIILSIHRILKLIFVLPTHDNDLYKDLSDPLAQASLTFADLITMAIDKKPLEKKVDWKSQESAYKLALEGSRIMTIMNAYFSFFDQSKSFTPIDSQHLFSAEQSNFAYVNQIFTKTLGDSPYIKDKALNLNYFISNLDYYFGSLRLQNDIGAYRFQQGLFLMAVDPSGGIEDQVTKKNELRNYDHRNSAIISTLVDSLLLVGSQKSNNAPNNIF